MKGFIVKRLTLLACCAAVLCAAVWAPNASAAAPTLPVTGTIGENADAGTFEGTFTPTRFSVQGDQLVATGTLTGTLTDASGALIDDVTQTVTMPVTVNQDTASCGILDLVLGPLHLDLLGLVVNL